MTPHQRRIEAYLIALILILGVVTACVIVNTYISVQFALAAQQLADALSHL